MAQYADPATVSINPTPRVQPVSVLLLIAGVVGVLFCGLFYWQINDIQAKTKAAEEGASQAQANLTTLQPVHDTLKQYDTLATGLQALFSSQKRWEDVLGVIQKQLYKNMRVVSLQTSDKGVLTLTGVTPNYTEYAKMYAALTSGETQQYITNLQVVSVAKSDNKDQSEVTFTFQGTLTPAALAGGLAAIQVTQ